MGNIERKTGCKPLAPIAIIVHGWQEHDRLPWVKELVSSEIFHSMYRILKLFFL